MQIESNNNKCKMNTKNVTTKATKSPEKCNNSTNINNHHTSAKHSGPFYISHSLFENKRLRQKRYRWATALQKFANHQNQYQQQQQKLHTKTDRRKQKLTALRADVTIDLLSDDNDSDVEAPYTSHKAPGSDLTQAPILQLPVEGQQQLQQFIVYPGHIELSKVPNITLIPVQSVQPGILPCGASTQMAKRVKRKRKSQQPKRHAQPTIVNNESIVLSDDSDVEATDKRRFNHSATNVTTTLPAELTISRVQTPPTPTSSSTTLAASTAIITPPNSAQVDEEVTVSIVPRSSASGSCAKPTANELFPMLPDETTVHTVIANRTYELSLTKLREGLASCGIPEFSNGQQKVSPNRRKGRVVDTPPIVTPAPTPISLKLSSDLSISLISDDECEDADVTGQQPQQRHRNAESLLQKQPQLSVQHLQLPAAVSANTAWQPPRRRKLG